MAVAGGAPPLARQGGAAVMVGEEWEAEEVCRWVGSMKVDAERVGHVSFVRFSVFLLPKQYVAAARGAPHPSRGRGSRIGRELESFLSAPEGATDDLGSTRRTRRSGRY